MDIPSIIMNVEDVQVGGVLLDVNVILLGQMWDNYNVMDFKMRYFFSYIFSLLYVLSSYAIELSPVQCCVLEDFFRTMLEGSEGGYVLFGKKPICINGYLIEDTFLGENERHKISVYLREGASIWKQTNNTKTDQNIIIHVYNREDSLATSYIHVLFINKNLFLNTVQSSLPLFQYVLGPEITPESLLQKLVDPNEKFHSVLKNDKVLIGILLGYGVQNSLYVSRIENLEEMLFSPEKPPFKNLRSKFGEIRKEYEQMLLSKSTNPKNVRNDLQPSFGYKSLKDELHQLCQKIDVSSQNLARRSPPFIFGRLKMDKQTDQFVKGLEDTQLKISELLSSDTLLKDVLKLINHNEEIIIPTPYQKSNQLPFDEKQSSQLSYLVGANIWKVLEDENDLYVQSFLNGMEDLEKDRLKNVVFVNSIKYENLKALIEANKNIKIAEEYFDRLDKDSSFIRIIPHRLYYKILQEGSGIKLDKQINVTVNYAITSLDDQVLANTFLGEGAVDIDLLETIPGFLLGMKEMKVGEIREIFIHPSLAYGIYTNLEKGIYIKAKVQLIAFDKIQNENKLGSFKISDLTIEDEPNIDLEFQEEIKKIGYADGYRIWQHYMKNKLYSFSSVLSWINQFQAGVQSDISSQSEQDMINQLHWNIYLVR
jgi:FKBP-type peptidyl-prolyl cis-trans isomerase